jgi:hypothetical protein
MKIYTPYLPVGDKMEEHIQLILEKYLGLFDDKSFQMEDKIKWKVKMEAKYKDFARQFIDRLKEYLKEQINDKYFVAEAVKTHH